jgi:hypothetical protein
VSGGGGRLLRERVRGRESETERERCDRQERRVEHRGERRGEEDGGGEGFMWEKV